jgi:hypothetical protein
MRASFVIASIVACVALFGAVANAADTPSAEAIFAHAKDAWRTRQEVPFIAYSMRERYEWRGRTHDNWWQVAYRDRDRALALRRTIVAADEAKRLRGSPITFNLKVHKGNVHADSLDTNPDADAFPILEPQIEPNASFGLVRREPRSALVGNATPLPDVGPVASAAASTPAPTATPTFAPAALVTEKPLREVARIEAVARDYAIVLAGTESIRGVDAYHLALTPLRNPRVYRLRDLWVDTTTFGTVQLAIQGIFEGKPYDDARWTVAYTAIAGRYYVQQIHTEDTLRFGLDRTVTGLTFDFVGYDFPTTIPIMMFQRML